MRPLGQCPNELCPLPQHVFCGGGEGQGEGASRTHQPSSRFAPTNTESTTKREIGKWSTHAPLSSLSPPNRPKGGRFQGERRRIGWNADPGRRE